MHARTVRLASAVAVAAVALGGWPAAPGAQETRRFRAAGSDAYGWEWRPSLQRIARGDRIRWVNHTNVAHTVRAYGGNWSFFRRIEPHERAGRVFRRAGLYRFRCTIRGHSRLVDGRCTGMCGRVRVRRS